MGNFLPATLYVLVFVILCEKSSSVFGYIMRKKYRLCEKSSDHAKKVLFMKKSSEIMQKKFHRKNRIFYKMFIKYL